MRRSSPLLAVLFPSLSLSLALAAACAIGACDKKGGDGAGASSSASASSSAGASVATNASGSTNASPSALAAGACAKLAKEKADRCEKLSNGDPTILGACRDGIDSMVKANDDTKCLKAMTPSDKAPSDDPDED